MILKMPVFDKRPPPALAIAFALTFTLAPDRGEADEVDAPIVAMIVDRDQESSIQFAISAVAAYVADLPVDFRIVWIDRLEVTAAKQREMAGRLAADTGARFLFWLDLENQDRVFFHIERQDGAKTVYRILKSGDPSEHTEMLAIVVRASIETMLRGGDIEEGAIEVQAAVEENTGDEDAQPASKPAEPPLAPSPSPSPSPAAIPPSPTRPEPSRIGLELAYSLGARSTDLPLSMGLSCALALRFRGPISLFAGYAFLNLLDRSTEGVSLEIRRHPASLGARAMASVGRVGIGGEVAVFVDTMTIDVKMPETIEAYDTSPEVEVSISLLLRVCVHIAWRISAFASAGIELPMNPARFVVRDASLSEPVVATTWAVRPAGLIGLVADLF